MDLAGKYMMEEMAPHNFTKGDDPSRIFNYDKGVFSTMGNSPSRLLLEEHPQYAFNAQGLGFSPDYPS